MGRADDATAATFRSTFRLDELTISSDERWTISVRPAQPTLGSLVISATQQHLDFQDLSAEEQAALTQTFARVEHLAVQDLGATRINLLCLMMKDPIVHFHVLPRYPDRRSRFGVTWDDAGWPGPPELGAVHELPDGTLEAMREEFQGLLQSR